VLAKSDSDEREVPMPFQKSTRRVLRLLVSVATLAVLAISGAVVVAANAATQPSVVTGRGVWIAGHTDFVGYYRANVNGQWLKVYCVSPDRLVPVHITLRTRSSFPEASVATTRLLAETLSAHGNARTATEAEAVSQALNEEIGNHDAVARRAKYLSTAVRDLAARYVAEARAEHGPYTLRLHLPSSPLPGGSGVGTVTLRSATRGVAGTVMLRHTANVALPSSVRTNSAGEASFTYRTIGSGPVHVSATARVAPTTLRASLADRSTQVMLTRSPQARVQATATYQAQGPRFTHKYACTTECAGHPRVTLTACAPANQYASRITYWIGTTAHRIDFPAANTRECSSWQGRIADSVSVSATWRYWTPRGWSAPLPAQGAFVVDCPAAPQVAVLLSYDCQDATLAVVLGAQRNGELQPLHNATQHDMVLVVDGAVSGRYVLAHGSTATVHTFPLSCGKDATVNVRGGVERTNGAFNYGPAASVALP
jgi:hypothetical protein